MRHLDFVAFLLVICLGACPQLLQSAIFVETPYFSNVLTEGVAISAWVIFGYTIGNAFTFLFGLINSKLQINDKLLIVIAIVSSVYLCIMTALFWSTTIAGKSYGVLLFAICSSAIGNTSVMIFFAYVSHYKRIYISAMALGFSFSGIIAVLASLPQNVAHPDNMRLSASMYFSLIGCIVAFLAISFMLLECIPQFQTNEIKSSVQDIPLEQVSEQSKEGDDDFPVVDVDLSPRRTFNVDLNDSNDLLVPQDMDILFTSPITTGNDDHESKILFPSLKNLTLAHPEQFVPPPQTKKIAVYYVVAFWVGAITFYLPGVIPYQTANDTEYFWLNAIFLVFPSVGAALAGVYQFKHFWILVILQSVLGLWMEFPSFEITYQLLPAPFWLLCTQMSVFVVLSGYNGTLVYFSLRHSTVPSLTGINPETRCRLAGFLSQFGGALGSALCLLLAYLNLYHEVNVQAVGPLK